MNVKTLKTRLLATSVFVGALGSFSAPGLAQETEADAVQDTVFVTGSRIAKQDFTANSPIATVDSEAFEYTGTVNTEDLLNSLPQLVPGFGRTSNNPGDGTATADLRGLGASRTLVLVDGKRMVPTRQTGVVDLNNIPAAMIERVEVITGGASAVYGSDAVAGVVNFILKDDFEGIEAAVGFETTQEADASYYTLDLTAGANFDDGRGNVTLNMGYVTREALLQGDRDFSAVTNADNGINVPGFGTTGSSGVPAGHLFGDGGFTDFNFTALGFETPTATVTGNTVGAPIADYNVALAGCTTPGLVARDSGRVNPVDVDGDGLIDIAGFATNPAYCGGDLIFNAAGESRPWIDAGPGNDRYNYAPDNYLQLPQERYSATSTFSYDINENVEAYGRMSAAFNQVPQQLAPTPAFTYGTTQLDNPFLGANTAAQFAERAAADIARQQGIITQQNAIIASGLATPAQITAANSAIAAANAQIAFLDPDADGTAEQVGFFIGRRMVETGPRVSNDDFFAFQFVAGLKGELLDTNVGYDVYFQSGRTQRNTDLEGDIAASRFQQAVNATDDGSGNAVCVNTANGCAPLNVFGAGNIDAASAAFVSADLNSKTEYNQIIFGASLFGDTEGFFNLPGGPVGWAAGVEYREDESDFRASDALQRGDLLGFNSAPNLGGSFDVYDVYAETYLPLLADLPFMQLLALEGAVRYSDYSTVGGVEAYKIGGEWEVNDQFRARVLFNTATRAPNINELFSPQSNGFPAATDPCSASQNPAAAGIATLCQQTGVANVGVYEQRNTQIEGIFGGNPNLDPEDAETLTIGFVYSPSFIPGLTASLDYYDIEVTNYITSFGGGVANVLNNCYDIGAGGANATASASNPFCQAINRGGGGEPIVLVTNQNVAALNTSGFDLQVNYATEFDFVPGEFAFSILATALDEWEFQADETADLNNCNGRFGQTFCDDPYFEYKHTATLNYRNGPIGLNLIWDYLGEVEDEDFYTTGVPQYDVNEIDAKSYFDMSATWDVNDNLRLLLGVDNLLDEEPPVLGDANSEQANTYPATYDPFGRTFFVSARMKF